MRVHGWTHVDLSFFVVDFFFLVQSTKDHPGTCSIFVSSWKDHYSVRYGTDAYCAYLALKRRPHYLCEWMTCSLVGIFDRKQDLNLLNRVCVFWADRKNQDGRPGLWLTETFSISFLQPLTHFNESWQQGISQRPLPRCFVFRTNWKTKMAALAFDCLWHFRLFLCNRWIEFKDTWHEARTLDPLPSLCFSGPSENQDGSPGFDLHS